MMNKNKDHDKKNKKPRLAWSVELHRKFVHVVNLLGIENVVPRKILALMNDERLRKENVASHLQNVSPSDTVYQNDAVQEMLISTWHSDESLDSLFDDVFLQWWEDHNKDATDLSDVIGTSPNTLIPLKDVVNSNIGSIQDLVSVAFPSCISHESIKIGELRQEIAATRNETHQLRETIQALKGQQDMLVQVVLQVLPPNVLMQQ
ncbi:hypothetical protein Lal_00041665 [Lupinus albus]|nr:hypothetical protein Lal_00041665 [Lupinus albus]